MKRIGGFPELKNDPLHTYVTDSGRSSLRLILKSGLGRMKFLLPNFLCQSILDVFDDCKAVYSFYSVKNDMTIDFHSIDGKHFDVFYLIDYFGNRPFFHNPLIRNLKGILLEDCVFLPFADKPDHCDNWIGFNSFRKISAVADGSMVKSTIRLDEQLIHSANSSFSNAVYEAKCIKYEFLNSSSPQDRMEEKYLDKFREAGQILEKQKIVRGISPRSVLELFKFFRNLDCENDVRKRNFHALDSSLMELRLPFSAEPVFYSFYPIMLDKRDELRQSLSKKNIFLPVHWPAAHNIPNPLSEKIISIPLDSRYDENDMREIARHILDFKTINLE